MNANVKEASQEKFLNICKHTGKWNFTYDHALYRAHKSIEKDNTNHARRDLSLKSNSSKIGYQQCDRGEKAALDDFGAKCSCYGEDSVHCHNEDTLGRPVVILLNLTPPTHQDIHKTSDVHPMTPPSTMTRTTDTAIKQPPSPNGAITYRASTCQKTYKVTYRGQRNSQNWSMGLRELA